MTWLIIVGVFLLALGPLLLAMPSAKDKRLATLRAEAHRLGLAVQMTRLPHPSPTVEQRVSASGVQREASLACAAYRLPLQRVVDPDLAPDLSRRGGGAWRLQRLAGAVTLGLPEGWVWDAADAAAQAPPGAITMLKDLTSDVLAIEGARSSVAVYWLEGPGDDRLPALMKVLGALRDLQSAG